MTNTKKQLMTAIAMLVVAALALGTSTYAWFKANTNVEVETMQFSAQAVEDVQIALTTTAWGGQLDGTNATPPDVFKTIILAKDVKELYDGLAGGAASLTSSALEPASAANLPNFYKVANNTTAWEQVEGKYLAKDFAQVTNVREDCVKAIPLYLKSTSNTAIVFDLSKTLVNGDAAPAVRIGFKPEGGTPIIWAPSTAEISGRAKTTYGDTSADGITKAVSSTTTTGAITGYTTTLSDTTPIFTLEANVPKQLIVYIWLEGCDEDCVSGISSEDLSVSLGFKAKTN